MFSYFFRCYLFSLSDIHVGSQFQPKVFEKVVQEVNGLNPDAIVITGDLTNEGLVVEYEKCKRTWYQDLMQKKSSAISGNHDYRNTGYLHFKKYFPFEAINELSQKM